MPTVIITIMRMMVRREAADKGQHSYEASLYYWFGGFRSCYIKNKIKAGLWGEIPVSEGTQGLGPHTQEL